MLDNKPYFDDNMQLARYRGLLATVCAKEVSRMRDMCYVDTVEDPVFEEQALGVRISLHEVFADNSSDALYDVSYRFFVAYYGRFTLEEFSADPVPGDCCPPGPDLPFGGGGM